MNLTRLQNKFNWLEKKPVFITKKNWSLVISLFLFYTNNITSGIYSKPWSIQLNDNVYINQDKICLRDIGKINKSLLNVEDLNTWEKTCFNLRQKDKNEITKEEIEIQLIKVNLFPQNIYGEKLNIINKLSDLKYFNNNSTTYINTEDKYDVKEDEIINIIFDKKNISIQLKVKALSNAKIGEVIRVKSDEYNLVYKVKLINTKEAIIENE
ncbi:MAG: flagella basal body P-ring formation protein FlgA [Spirochaetia bacterium]|nr:flagella basal body P-ring formation protein FlgA [Spirochaetia bacterium]